MALLHILKCKACGSYGLDKKCSCGDDRYRPKPPKYSPEDKYGEYRRQFKEGQQEEDDDDDTSGMEDDDSQESEA